MEFAFDRSGVRIPAIAISPWIPERTVVNDEYRNSEAVAIMRDLFGHMFPNLQGRHERD
jgi:phospholipase C